LAARIAAAAGALAMGLVGLVGAAVTANATEVTGIGNIDPNAGSSLTIHKYDGNPGDPGDGTLIEDTGSLGHALSGVEFTITPVTAKDGKTIDLNTAEGWDLIDGVTVADVIAPVYSFGTPIVVTTAADGSIKTVLPHGLYRVAETGYGEHTVTNPAADFLVTLPLPQSAGQWLYDVHAYPKNVVDDTVPTKTVADPIDGVTIGSQVPWTIKAPVQPSRPGAITSFVISDELDPRLAYDSLTVAGYDLGEDYTVDVDDATNTVTVTFTASALATLSAGDVVTVTLVTKVVSLGDDGLIPNQAKVFTNNGEGKATNKPTTNWGVLAVLKHAEGDKAKTLSGAVFTVYRSSADANAGTHPVGNFTTNAEGQGSISLFVGNDADQSRTYYFKETAAPAGYILDATVREATVKPGATAYVVYEIANRQPDHPQLPLTGASGTIVMTVSGIALVLTGAGAYVVARKRSRH
jgi:fimbrial isopeptide formation D2 family protein/LPXTG-motif cell wall-anchored protein